MLALLAGAALAGSLKILFVGNSHTYVNDLPAMVKGLIESDGRGRRCTTKLATVEFLNDASPGELDLRPGAWDVVVLQGAKLSSSHQFKYANDGALRVAKAAKQSGARTLLFVEWSRRGWDESDWQLDSYKEIFRGSGAEYVDIPHIFDRVHAEFKGIDLWQQDGNHAQPPGTFIAAASIYRWIVGVSDTPSFVPAGVPKDFAQIAQTHALKRYRELGGN